MSEYTGNFFTIENSTVFDGQTVNVLEYRRNSKGKHTIHGYCYRCSRPLRNHWWTVQDADDVEICDIGSECVERLS